MSNHDGSYMLNSVLLFLHEKGIFEKLSEKERYEIVRGVLKIGDGHDCNWGEILEDIEEKLGIKID